MRGAPDSPRGEDAAGRPSPELTVAMPAYNASRFIRQALESALAQEDVDLEVIVVDDASTDDTAAVVASIGDPRITLLRNDTRRGIAACQNRIVEASRAPFIVHLDADDLLVGTHACRLLLDCLLAEPDVGQAHGYFFRIDEHGTVDLEGYRSMIRHQREHRRPGRDYRHALLRVGSVMNGPRMYRKSALLAVGPFDESIRFGVDFEMALRIVDRYRITVVPEVLYASRKHGSNTTRLRFPSLRFWLRRTRSTLDLTRTGRITFTRDPRYRPWKLLGMNLLQEAGILAGVRGAGLRVYRARRALQKSLRRSLEAADRALTAPLGAWPLPRERSRGAEGRAGPIGYYLWHFPVASQTFVRRELGTLRDRGVDVAIFADDAEPMDRPDELTRALTASTTYLRDADARTRGAYLRSFLLRRPLRTLSLYLYVRGHRYGLTKSRSEDRAVFRQAVTLAGLLEERGVRHLHAAWADQCAFVAMIAARLCGIPYSVQARAHDLHRHRSRFGLREKLGGARFVITNSDYNRDHIVGLLGPGSETRVHRVYNGVRAEPRPSAEPRSPAEPDGATRPARILTVARLIEEKGLVHLLHAARRLRDEGVAFHWEIVGGPERPTYTAYEVEMRALHRRLELEPVVTFTGSIPYAEVRDRLSEADLFVLPCVMAENGGRDIVPNSLLEAMAWGLPVISTTLASMPEVVTEGVDGVLVPPGDPEALARAVRDLLGDPGRRAELGARARETVAARFDSDHKAKELAHLFSGI